LADNNKGLSNMMNSNSNSIFSNPFGNNTNSISNMNSITNVNNNMNSINNHNINNLNNTNNLNQINNGIQTQNYNNGPGIFSNNQQSLLNNT
jgi:hypothetical protein